MLIRSLVRRALGEDIGPGDITTSCAIPAGLRCRALIYAKEQGLVAGLKVAEACFLELEPGLAFQPLVQEGERVRPGQPIARVTGLAAPILAAERTALNFLQRLSGIATMTARFVAAVEGTRTRILDTRKTAPGLRALDKHAVRLGGGQNHRFGLHDGILIKDNHIRLAGGIAKVVQAAREKAPAHLQIEVEAQSLDDVQEALDAGADIIMLDNMEPSALAKAVEMVAGRAKIEASGGVTEENVAEIAGTGVDFISVGSLTHSPKALDLSLEVEEVLGD